MGERNSKHVWLVSLATAPVVFGLMVVFTMLSPAPGEAQGQSVCDVATGATLQALIDSGLCPPVVGDASSLTAIKSGDGTTVELEWTPGANSNVHWVAQERRRYL